MRMDAKHVVQKAHQEMSHLKRHFLVVVFAELAEPPAKDVRAHPHAQHVPPPLQWTGANDSIALSFPLSTPHRRIRLFPRTSRTTVKTF